MGGEIDEPVGFIVVRWGGQYMAFATFVHIRTTKVTDWSVLDAAILVGVDVDTAMAQFPGVFQ